VHRVHSYWVYILASKPRGTLYIGVTNSLIRRVEEHVKGLVPGFTRRYRIRTLVWFQEFSDVNDAIQHKKTMKEWPRAWKINLIERTNLHWGDLYPSLPGVKPIPEDWSADRWIPGTSPGMTNKSLRRELRW
jgi:putative endonuclease